ncbi:hypothetical protein DFH28DRAFT_892350 [Melampsora americana]|nr:hypothetical protein DFH28DRAFT_892350 [Melampsora americana]
MTTPVCGRCQWRQLNPDSGRCQTPQCTSCGKCYPFLDDTECASCKKTTSALVPPPSPLSLTTPALAPNSNTPSIASRLPSELFQVGLLSQLSSNNASTTFSNPSRLDSRLDLSSHGSQRHSVTLNSQLQGSIRASQSGRRTIGQPKGRKKKRIEEEPKEESPELEISMSFSYLSGIGKSTIVHPLTPRKFNIDLNNADWFWRLGWDVYAYYLKEAVDSAWPSKQLQRDKKIHPLPPNFSPQYCIIAENGISVSKESMESTIRKSKKFDNKKFGLIFNMQKYLATLPKEPSPEPGSLKPLSRTHKQTFVDESDTTDDPASEIEASSSRTHTQKRKRMQFSSSEDDKIDSNINEPLNQPVCSQNVSFFIRM